MIIKKRVTQVSYKPNTSSPTKTTKKIFAKSITLPTAEIQ